MTQHAHRREWFSIIMGALIFLAAALRADEPMHPILTISGSGSGANTVTNIAEADYTNDFIPHSPPRNSAQGFAPAVVAGDSGWSWNSSAPNQIKSTPSGTVFPNNNPAYPVQTQAVTVFLTTATNNLTRTVNAVYYLKAGSTTSKSMVFNLIDYNKLNQLRSDLNRLSPAYLNSGSTPATRTDNYARRIAIALLDWARWHPSYYLTAINSPTYINVTPNYLASTGGFGPQRASDHNGLAHEWQVDELKAFDAIYNSVALTNLNTEMGFDVRQYICDNLFFDEGDFLVNHIPIAIAIQSNLSGPYAVLPQVARVLDRYDYISWMDSYLDATVRQKIRRDGALEEGEGYSIGYLNANQDAAQNTHDFFLTRPATNSTFLAISNRAQIYDATFTYGQGQWNSISLPSGQLPAFGDTPYNNYFSSHSAGNSALLPAYGTVAMGAGSGSQAVQVNQNFSGNNNHMRADMCAFVLWAFNNPYLDNIRYYNGAIGRNFGEQMLAYNTVEIDRANLSPYPDADTYGNGDLTLYEPGNSGLAMTELDGQRAYSSKASRFQRLLLLNTVDSSKPYVVDVFRVTGGTTHDYLFHGAMLWNQTWQCSFPLVTNSNPYPMLEPGDAAWDLSADTPYYGFWRNVSSNTAPGNFQITYADTSRTAGRDIRLWMTADPNTYNVYLGTTPVPARDNTVPTNFFNAAGLVRPSAIIRHRISSGTLQDMFVSVIEPFNSGVSNIVSVQRLPMNGSSLESCGLKITFKNGRVDTYIVNLRNPQVAGANTGSATVSTADGQYVLTGRIGLTSESPNGNSRVWTMNATDLKYPGGEFSTPTNTYFSGLIAGDTRKADGASYNAFTTTTPLPLGTAWRNKWLSFTHGALSGSGTTGISEMFKIDQVIFTNGLYNVCFTNDHDLEIADTLSVAGSGSDIWGTSDQFNYDYQSVSGDQSVTARVVSQDNTSSWAKSGVMIRETTATNASYVGLYVTPGNGVSLQCRSGAGTSAVDLARQAGLAAPYWLRLVRSGSTFTGYSSPDGVAWTSVGQTNVTMAVSATAGLAVCAHNNGALNTSAFDNISLAGPLTDADIGAVGLAGSASSGQTSTEQVAPLRTFTGSNSFELALSAATQPISVIADQRIPPDGSSGPLSFNFGNLGTTAGGALQVSATSSNQALIPNSHLVIGGNGTNRTITVTPVAGQTGNSLITISVTDGVWTNRRSFNVVVETFGVAASPASQAILAGNSATYLATLGATNGFTGTVTFGFVSLPANLGASFNPPVLTGAGSSVLTVTASNGISPGTYLLSLTAVSGSLSSTSSVTLVVTNIVAGPGTVVWTGTNNWSTPLNWTNLTSGGHGPPGAVNDVLFTSLATVAASNTVNNVVDSDTAISSLTFNNTNGFHTTLINPGRTLTAGGLTVGTETDDGNTTTVYDTITGSGGALVVSNVAGALIVRQGSANSGSSLKAMLNLSGLDNFNATVGKIEIGSLGANPRPCGIVYLARTNLIVAFGSSPAIQIGGQGGGSGNAGNGSFLYLGQVNEIFANGISVATVKQGNCSLLFNRTLANPTAVFRGADGVSRVPAWAIGDSQSQGGTVNTTGTNDFTGGTVDALVDTMTLGRSSSGSSGNGRPAGTLTFEAGTIDVNTLQIGYQSSGGPLGNIATGIFNVNGTATLKVNSGVELGHIPAGGTNATTGTLNLNNGTVAANNILGGGGTAIINLNSGVLDSQSGVITNITRLNLGASGLASPAQLINAAIIQSPNAINVFSNGTLSGNATVTVPSLALSGAISPGGDSAGSLTNNGSVTFGAGGRYVFDLADAIGQPGTDWDFLSISGGLEIQATGTNPFVIQLRSIDQNLTDNNSGAADFGNDSSQAWVIATAAGGVTNFSAEKFSVDASGFANDLAGGSFSVQTNGNSLLLVFTSRPAPPFFGGLTVGGANLIFSGAGGGSNGVYYVLASTNLAAPLGQWRRLATNSFDGHGNFIFTNRLNSGGGQQFYQLQLP